MAQFLLYILVAALTGWATRHQQAALAYLVEENRGRQGRRRPRLGGLLNDYCRAA